MGEPRRIQLSRRKGWRMPENTVSVARPGPWGNPHRVLNVGLQPFGDEDDDGIPTDVGPWLCQSAGADKDHCGGWFFPTEQEAATKAVELYRWRMTEQRVNLVRPPVERLSELHGKNLACWCPLCNAHKDGKPFGVECADCSPCHSEVLGELANSENGCGGNHA